MFYNILIAFLFVTSVQAQVNGEFWWLNSKLNNLKKVRPSSPKIDVNDFQRDEEEKAKIIFRDDDFFINKLKPINDRTSRIIPNENNINTNRVIWPTDEHMKNHDVEVFTTKINEMVTKAETKPSKIQNKYDDVLIFSYPKNDKYVTNGINNANTESISTTSSTQTAITESQPSTKVQLNTNKILLATTSATTKQSQNICTYTKKDKCNQLNGFVYEYARRVPVTSDNEPLICCILPIEPILDNKNVSQTIHFPRIANNQNRVKRSDFETSIALKQRDFLLKHKFSTQRQSVKPTTSITKIVTPSEEDYADPYWNIKNNNFQSSTAPTLGHKYDYYSEDYDQEYTDELPKPGLVGLYSDHAKSPSSWSIVFGNQGPYGGSYDDYEDENEDDDNNDDVNTFGYGDAIDPRKGNKKPKQKRKPSKMTTVSGEETFNAESHIINFQSNPDFHVFQGFKLLNLFRNTSRLHSKKNAVTTPHEGLSKEVLVSAPEDSGEFQEVFDGNQLFDGCGKVGTKNVNEKGNQIGEAASDSHPWLALVVLTKSRHNVLCYATLIHPRAAVTVADCVDGTAQGDVTVLAGLWDLNDRSRSKSRVATVYVHPRYKPGDAENNLAILHWMRPFRLSSNIQPACLAEPHIGEECKFFGWGNLNQGIQEGRSRWQRAIVRACSSRTAPKSQSSFGKAFCVSTSRATVTGMGGPLICEVNGHSSIVGAVVFKDNGFILSTIRDWTTKMGDLVSGD